MFMQLLANTANGAAKISAVEWVLGILLLSMAAFLVVAVLLQSGKDKKWLTAQLSALGYADVKDVLLATCDLNNKLTIFAKNKGRHSEDIFD